MWESQIQVPRSRHHKTVRGCTSKYLDDSEISALRLGVFIETVKRSEDLSELTLSNTVERDLGCVQQYIILDLDIAGTG